MNQEGLYLEFDGAVTYISCIGLLIHTKELNCSIFRNPCKNRKGLLWISFFYVERFSMNLLINRAGFFDMNMIYRYNDIDMKPVWFIY